MSLESRGFVHAHGELVCDGVPVSAIAQSEGTPFYVYSASTIAERYRALDGAFEGYPHALHYALKANSLLALVELIRRLGGCADANSIWEVEVARRAGVAPADIVFTGVGKAPLELECAARLGLKAINVESAGELERVEAFAKQAGHPVRVAIRINPDIDAGSHRHITTGLKTAKFGLPAGTVRELAATLAQRPFLSLVAIHVHVGSQITRIEPLRQAAAFAAAFARDLVSAGIHLEYLDVGGGLGIAYDDQAVVSPREYVSALVDEVRSVGLPIVIEPGRAIVGAAGALIARVVDVKPRDQSSDFVVLDAGMTELLRPALYDAYHRIEPVSPRAGAERMYEFVGPVCETTDVVGKERRLPVLVPGDLVAIRDAGAYGSAMASNYNRRPLPVEVLAEEGVWRVVRRRQSVDDLLGLETS